VPAAKRTTVYLEPLLVRALRRKAAATDRTVSNLINDAVRDALAEYANDLAAIDARRTDPTRSFETFVACLRRRGKV